MHVQLGGNVSRPVFPPPASERRCRVLKLYVYQRPGCWLLLPLNAGNALKENQRPRCFKGEPKTALPPLKAGNALKENQGPRCLLWMLVTL